MPTDKPRWECPVEVKRMDDGTIAFSVTLRDGSIQIVPGPPGVVFDHLLMPIAAYQQEGSDELLLHDPLGQ